MPRQLRNKGGITNVVPREGFIFGGITKRIRKLIPNEIANFASKAAPFVAPFNPGAAALMRGIGRFDKRGSFSDAIKQGLGTFAFGKAAGYLGGAQSDGGIFGGQTFSKQGFSEGPVGRLFQGGKEKLLSDGGGGSGKGVEFIKKGTEMFKDVPILSELPSIVQQQILVGGATAAGSYIYQKFLADEPPQEEGETMEEYLARRKQNVGNKMRTYFDNYFKFDPEYSALDDAGKNAFVARYNLKKGGRIGYSSGSGEKAFSKEENLKRFEAAKKLAKEKGISLQEALDITLSDSYRIEEADGGRVGYQTGGITMANTLAENIRRNIANQAAVAQQFQAARSRLPGYVEPVVQPAPAPIQPTPVDPSPPTIGPVLPVEPPTQMPIEEEPKVIPIESNIIPIPLPGGGGGFGSILPGLIGDVLDQDPDAFAPQPILEDVLKKLPVAPDPDTPIEELIDGPFPPTLPVEPMTDQQILEGFAEFKRQNPDLMNRPATQAIVNLILPGGTPISFRSGAGAAALNQYLESIGMGPAQRGDYPTEKLAGGGMPTGIMKTNKAGVMERDYRDEGGFVPVGIKEKADDVPAMLSKNEFVFTADAVRGAGNGSIEKGAQKMYDTMKKLEKRVV